MAATSASHFSPQPSAVLRRHRTITASFAINLRHAKSKGQVSARSSQQHSRALRFKVHSMRQPVNREVTKESWEEKILKSEIPVLVEFHATWCGPCRMVHRVIDEIAEEYAGKLKCWILNTDSDLEIAEDYEIKAVPVVLIFKNGVKKESIVGTMPKEFYIAAIERVLKL